MKVINFHKVPNDIVDLVDLKKKAGRDSDFDSNKAALIRVQAQGFNEKTMLDFSVYPEPGIEIIYKEFKNGEMWLYVSSKCMGTIVFKYMGEFKFNLPNKLEPQAGYELILGMETATLVINTIPSNAEIVVDGKKIGTGYGSTAISVGSEHRYKVSCNYYMPEEDVIKADEAVKIVKQIELRPNFNYITIKSEPSGAEIYIDGKKVGTTPYLSEMIEFGRRRVELRKYGYEPYVKVVTIKADEDENTQLADVKLTAIRVPMGSLELSSEPAGAVITINGRQYGQTPKTLTDFEVGTYTVYFSKEGYQNLSQTVEVKDGKKETLAVTMTKASVPQQPVPTTPVAGNTNTSVNKNSSNGVFSVASGRKVQFSKGNLQYQASTKTWRFAEHQWDVIGEANKNISSSYSGWIDLFGWGTSGYNGKNPWMTSTTSTDYGNGERDIAGTNYDWGVNNTISNGGGKSWRTLTKDEWVYVFNTRNTSSGIRYAKATVNGVNGVILLPDNWSSVNYSLSNTNKSDASFSSNHISQSDWTSKLEANGAVFLPAAGYRYGTDVYFVGSHGYYWSASYYGSSDACFVYFRDSSLLAGDWDNRFRGQGVRLVCPAQ